MKNSSVCKATAIASDEKYNNNNNSIHHRRPSHSHSANHQQQQQPTAVYECPKNQNHLHRPHYSHPPGHLPSSSSASSRLLASKMFSSNTSNKNRLATPSSPGAKSNNNRGQLPIHRSDGSSHRVLNSSSNISSSSKRNHNRSWCPPKVCTNLIPTCLAGSIVWALFMFIWFHVSLDGYHRVLDLSNSTTAASFMPDFMLLGLSSSGAGAGASHELTRQAWKLAGAQEKAITTTTVAARPLTVKQQQRRERTRPPVWTALPNNGIFTSTSSSSWLQSSSTSSSLQRKTVHVDWNNRNWKDLCNKAHVNEHSHIVISNLLSQPAASATAMFLHQQCNVTHMAGTDSLFPNMRLTRMRYMQIYQTLLQQIPTLQFVMTANGGLARRKLVTANTMINGFESFVLDDDWLQAFAPTHVLLMETTPLFANDRFEAIMSRSSYRLYTMKKSRELWTDIIHFWRAPKTSNHQHHQHPLRVLHVTSTMTTSAAATATTATAASPMNSPVVDAARQVFTSTWPSMLMEDEKMSLTSVELPPLYGPWVTSLESDLWKNETLTSTTIGMDGTSPVVEDETPHLYVDDAIMAILTGLQVKSVGLHQVYIPDERTVPMDDLKKSLQMRQEDKTMDNGNAYIQETLSWKSRLQYPYGGMQYQNVTPPWWKPSVQFAETYGLQPTRMPCASQCTESGFKCTPSVFDEAVVNVSRNATAGCHLVLYMSAFDDNVSELFETKFPDPERICRIAYVSVHAPIVQKSLDKRSARLWNGQVMANHWKLVWLDIKGGERSLNDGDLGLLKIDPSRLFAPSVLKAMHVSSRAFAAAPDSKIFVVMDSVDEKRPPKGTMVREQRSGTELSRWVAVPDEPARNVALFGGAPPDEDKPTSVDDYLDRVAAKYGVHKKDRYKLMPRHQLSFYKQVAHLVHVNEDRPEFEVQRTLHKQFPFEWTTDFFFVHDMSMEESRVLRCRWFDEYLGWGHNRHVIDLSLAYILAELRTLRQLGWTKSQQQEQLDTIKNQFWSPLLAPPMFDEEDEPRILTVKNGDAQIFLRLLQPQGNAE